MVTIDKCDIGWSAKKLVSFRFWQRTLDQLDDLVEQRKQQDKQLGFGFFKTHNYTRTRVLELLIETAHGQLMVEKARALELADVPPAKRKRKSKTRKKGK